MPGVEAGTHCTRKSLSAATLDPRQQCRALPRVAVSRSGADTRRSERKAMCMAIVPMAGLSSGVIAGVPFGVPFDRPARRPTGRAAFGDSLAGMPEELQTL